MITSRGLGITATIAALLAVSACTAPAPEPSARPDLEAWLQARPEIASVHEAATFRAELVPAATDEQIATVTAATVDFLGGEPAGTDVDIDRGGYAFTVTSNADQTASALTLWHKVVRVPDIVRAVVTPTSITVDSLDGTAYSIFESLEVFGVDRVIHGYHTIADLQASTVEPSTLRAAADCQANEYLVELTRGWMDAPVFVTGTIDPCVGISLTLTPDYAWGDALPRFREELEDNGLGSFPFSETKGNAPNTHTVAITPGSPEALGVVGILEQSPIPMHYVLDASRALEIDSTAASLRQLYDTLSDAYYASSLTSVTITGTDGTISGAFTELAGQLP